MPPIQKLPGEDSGQDLAPLFNDDDAYEILNRWGVYQARLEDQEAGRDPDAAPF